MSAPTITTGQIARLLWPGLNARWGNAYNEHPTEYTELFSTFSSDMAYEEDQEMTGFGLAPIKPQGQPTFYDTASQGATSRYTHVAYSLGFIITREAIKDNLYEKIGMQRTGSLAFSMRQTKENVAANVYNRAFNSAFTGGDGKEMIATDHPTPSGNQSNELAVAADLSEAALEDLVIMIGQATNARGLRIALQPRKLIVAVQNQFEATRILRSAQQSGTANNDVNALKAMGMFQDGVVVNHYLSDPDAFFIRTNAPDGLKHFEREAVEFSQDGDFDTNNLKYKAYERYSFGWTDWRGVFGSPGA